MTLGDYLATATSREWAWGRDDCCTFLAGWVMARGHSDPMHFIRGRYRSEFGALRSIKQGGGLVPLWRRGMADVGIPEADEPQAGDVAVLAIPTEAGPHEACGIFSGARWVLRTSGGFFASPARPLALWRP